VSGHEVTDFGPASAEFVRLPGLCAAGGRAKLPRARDRGILVCSTGIGMAMAANQIAGVRAAPPFHEDECAADPRTHTMPNVADLGRAGM